MYLTNNIKSITIVDMIGERIKEARKAANLSQTELAELCGWDQGRQSHYELNRYEPNTQQIAEIAKHTNVDPSELAGFVESSEEHLSEEDKAISKETNEMVGVFQSLSSEDRNRLIAAGLTFLASSKSK